MDDLGAILQYSNYFKEIEPIYSTDTDFDSKHINNLAPNKMIPEEIIEHINKGITLEELDDITSKGCPVCKYKTQITIHGLCPTIKNDRVYGYVALVKNKNQSLGVRWIAVDYKKKAELADYLGVYGWSYYNDSQTDCLLKEFPFKKENMEAVHNDVLNFINNIDKSLFYGKIDLLETIYNRNSYIVFNADDHYTVVLYIQGIYKKNIPAFLEKVCGESYAEIERKYHEWYDEMKKKRDEKEAQKKEEAVKRENQKEEHHTKFEQWKKDNPFPERFKLMTFDDIRNDDIVGYYKETEYYDTENVGKKCYKQIYSNYKRLCSRVCNENGEYNYKSGHVISATDFPNPNEIYIYRKSAGNSYVTETSVKPTPNDNKIEVLDYGNNQVAVLGYSKSYYMQLKNLGGGKWNKFIKIEGRPMAQGWLFPSYKRESLKKIFGITNEPTEHELFLERMNAKAVRLEEIKIENN